MTTKEEIEKAFEECMAKRREIISISGDWYVYNSEDGSAIYMDEKTFEAMKQKMKEK